jgi:prepilin-type N-terminal cleavage/methylation domain-containing protein
MKTTITPARAAIRKRKSRPPGLTLIELLIVVAISAVVFIALLSLYIGGMKYFFNQNSRADTIEESRMPMAWVSRDIRDASEVFNGTLTAYDGSSYTTGQSCLVLEVPSLDATGNISAATDYIVYAWTGNRLVRIIDADESSSREDGSRVLADNLLSDGSGGPPFKLRYFRSDGSTEILSGYNDAFIVEVELTSQGRAILRAGQNFVETVRTQAKLRNKVVPGT